MPLKDLKQEIGRRFRLRGNPVARWIVESNTIFQDYLAPKFAFQKRYNPWMLFFLNNS